jgi:hypothetical protein
MRALRNVLALWLLLALGASAFFFDRVPPHAFMRSWLLPLAAGALVLALLVYFLSRMLTVSLRLGGARKTLLVVLVLAMGAAAIYFPRVASEKALLARAQPHFILTRHGSVEQNRVDYTLIQMEKGLETYQAAAGAKGFVPIKVELYPDAARLRADTGLEAWAGGFTSYASGAPVIYLPAVADDSGVADTPEHEVIHALVYQRLGQAGKTLPDWFSEGTAQYFSQGGWARLPSRDVARLGMWRNGDAVLSAAEFQSFSTGSAVPDEDIFFFYDCAYEFTRHLCRQSGEGCIIKAMDGVASGSSLAAALSKATGQSFEESYSAWVAAFWGI